MLALRRKPGESIVLSHPSLSGDITITVTRIEGERVVLGIAAHSSVIIARKELLKNGPWQAEKPEQKGA